MIVDTWSMLSKKNLNRAWNKLIPAEFQSPEPSDELTEIVDLYFNIPGFGECDEEDAQLWLAHDDDPGYQIMNNEEIVALVEESQEALLEDEYDNSEENPRRPSNDAAPQASYTAMEWYENQEEGALSNFFY